MTSPPLPDPLGLPVGSLTRPVTPVESVVSIRSAARAMAENGLDVLPVVREGRYVGVVGQRELARALANGVDPNDELALYMRPEAASVRTFESGAEALRRMSESGETYAVVIDDDARVVGVLTPSRLFNPPRRRNRPRMVGGMATPLGVYLTSGTVNGGAPWYGLVLTGALMACLFVLADTSTTAIRMLLPVAHRFDNWVVASMMGLTFFLFLLLLRVIPLSGTHAAEHMTVHAIERGEDLVPETVRRMPRVHPRCGTNYIAGLTIFSAIAFTPIGTLNGEISLLLGLAAAFLLWRPVGSLIQFYFTTRPPNAEQIQTGIKAGEELLANYERAPHSHPTPWRWIVNSGLPYVLLGGWVTSIAIYGLEIVLRVPDVWRVQW